MKVDTVAAMQGIYDARGAGVITAEQADRIKDTIFAVSESNDVGRKECDFLLFVAIASSVNMPVHTFQTLFENHLVRSLVEGLGVAAH